MIITRKIQIFIPERDKDLRKEYYQKLYENRDCAVQIANMGISHLFMLDHTTTYLSAGDREKLTYLGCPKADGHQNEGSKRNATYVAASIAFKGKADMGMASCVLQEVGKVYKDDRKKGMWNRSLRSFKSNMPIPFKADRFTDLRFAEYTDENDKVHVGCFFTLIGIPFQMKFGRDRSNNQAVVEAVIKGAYKMCTSSIKIEESKIFLLLCVDIPQDEGYCPRKGKTLHCYLGIDTPIIYSTEVVAKREEDSGYKVWTIGTAEEFNQRRRQIQESVKRCQIANRYTSGGKGRQRKCQAIDRWHAKERNYVETKLHTYSRLLVDAAVKHKCEEIRLWNQVHREEKAKEQNATGRDPTVLRNWSYYNLKTKIAYKAKFYGIAVSVEK